MIGGKSIIIRGSYLSLALVVLGFTGLLLWTWENNSFRATLLSVQHQFSVPFSEAVVGVSNGTNTSMSTEGPIFKELKNAVEETDPPSLNFKPQSPLERKDGGEWKTSSTPKEVCNYAKGKWVEDSRRPLYSGFECQQWLSGMWACRLMERADYSYEGFRWQPKDCNMPEFERSSFLERMQDKTIAIVGDSLGRQQFQSLMCMATGGKESPEIENVGWVYGLVKPRGAIRPDGWAYRFPSTNTTILYYWSASLSDLVTINPRNSTSDIAMHLDRPPAFLRQFLHRFDILVLNTGHHWNRGKFQGNRWVMHVNGKPNDGDKLTDISDAKNFTVYSVVKWVDSQLELYPNLKVFFRTISPRHFQNGDWNTGGSCNNTTPLTGGSEVLKERSSDRTVEGAVKGTRVKILDITALSELRDESHISSSKPKPRKSRKPSKLPNPGNDCLHWCLPGIPDTWNELLVAQI